MADRVGQQLGNYRLVRLLGQGSSAEVYLGKHFYLETQAAIKVLHTQLAIDDIEQFRIEARTIALLEHPNIVRVFDFGVEDDTPFLAMSYAPNGTLAQRHPKGTRLPLETIVTHVKQVASALQYAHDLKIIHRDVKPQNMLLGRNNEVLLSDFGIAVAAQSTSTFPTIAGTPAYIAPEQIQGKPRPASDQYALGVTVYEWLCGEHPFRGSFTEIVSMHMFTPPPPLHEKVPEISPAIEQVVLRALAKKPQERYESVEAFAHALEEASGLKRSDLAVLPSSAPLLSPPPTSLSLSAPSQQRSLENVTMSSIPPPQVDERTFTSTSFDTLLHTQQAERIPTRVSLFRTLLTHAQVLLRQAAQSFRSFVLHVREWLAQQISPTVEVKQPSTLASSRSFQPQSHNPSTLLFPESLAHRDSLKNFFIFYNKADRSWAEWIAWQLEEAGYSTVLPAWDFRLGSNIDIEMQKATAKAERIIAVLSPDYLNARSPESKWTTTIRRSMLGKQGILLPVYVRECGYELRKPLESIMHIDLVGKDESSACEMLLAGVRFERSKPAAAPAFPGKKISRSLTEQPPFPVSTSTIDSGTLLMQQMMSQITDALTRRDIPQVDPSTTLTQQMLPQIQIAFIRKDWLDVIRKTDYLIKRAPTNVSSQIYRLQWQALLEEKEIARAQEALDAALALITDSSERLLLLKDCTAILTKLDQWEEAQRYINEALHLAPHDSYWLALQKETFAHLRATTLDQGTDDTNTTPKIEDSDETIKGPTRIIKQDDQSDQSTFVVPPQPTPTRSIEIFFAYARKDEELRDELAKQLSILKWQQLITGWHDREISAGNEWAKEIDQHLNTAHIILLLVSADFTASEYCYGTEVTRALQRHEAREARVIPIILRPVDWKNTPLGKLQALPRDGIPVTSWINRDEAFYSVAQGIRKAVEQLSRNP